MKTIRFVTALCGMALLCFAEAEKPKVWIISDAADKHLERAPGKPVTDPDDISALAGYLLMSNEFDTRGIVVGANANANPAQGKLSMKVWAEDLFLSAYKNDLSALNASIGGYQQEIRFGESFLWSSPATYQPEKIYRNLAGYSSVQALFDEVESSESPIYVLCWGMLTEPAVLINHCLATGREDVLRKVRFISHWTSSYFHVGTMAHPERVHNAFNDAEAAAYVKRMALSGLVTFYECAAIGQYGIVEGSPRGREFYDQFRGSALGRVYVDGKFLKDHR